MLQVNVPRILSLPAINLNWTNEVSLAFLLSLSCQSVLQARRAGANLAKPTSTVPLLVASAAAEAF